MPALLIYLIGSETWLRGEKQMDGLYKNGTCGNSLAEITRETDLATSAIAENPNAEDSENRSEFNTDTEILADVSQIKRGFALKRILAAMICAVGFSAYAYIAAMFVSNVLEQGIVSFAAERIFGGVSVVIEPDTDTANTDGTDDEPGVAVAADSGIVSADLSQAEPCEIFNETAYSVDTAALPGVLPFGDGAEVLVIHTHGTEAYYSGGELEYETFRSSDPSQSVIAVGEAIADVLLSKGITCYHVTEAFDGESYVDAYARSASAVAECLESHPAIELVLDVHRDAVIRDDGSVVKTNGDGAAQLMLVCGTDEQGALFPHWRENLAFAAELQSRLNAVHPKLMRHIDLRGASFNEQLCGKYLLLEVGSCANTLAEAINSVELAANAIAEMILGE